MSCYHSVKSIKGLLRSDKEIYKLKKVLFWEMEKSTRATRITEQLNLVAINIDTWAIHLRQVEATRMDLASRGCIPREEEEEVVSPESSPNTLI